MLAALNDGSKPAPGSEVTGRTSLIAYTLSGA